MRDGLLLSWSHMHRRSLLSSLLMSPLVFFHARRAQSTETSPAGTHWHGSMDDAPSRPGDKLAEVRWEELSNDEQGALAWAASAVDGCAGAVFPWDFPSHPRWRAESQTDVGLARLKAWEGLYRRGLLTFTSKMPEHYGDLCGWYTISQYGREVATK